MLGGGDTTARREEPSHRCKTCGEEYYSRPSVEISSCRACGGTEIKTL
jgi:ribosomal protein L37AE/L43A